MATEDTSTAKKAFDYYNPMFPWNFDWSGSTKGQKARYSGSMLGNMLYPGLGNLSTLPWGNWFKGLTGKSDDAAAYKKLMENASKNWEMYSAGGWGGQQQLPGLSPAAAASQWRGNQRGGFGGGAFLGGPGGGGMGQFFGGGEGRRMPTMSQGSLFYM